MWMRAGGRNECKFFVSFSFSPPYWLCIFFFLLTRNKLKMEDEKRSTQMSLIHSSWWRKQIFNFCITFQSFYFQWMQHEDNLVLVFLSVAKFFKGRSGWLVRSIVFFFVSHRLNFSMRILTTPKTDHILS